MQKLNIAVLDDGIQLDVLEALSGRRVEIDRLQLLNGDWVEQYALTNAKVNHGTICTALLIDYLERYGLLDAVEIASLSIVNPEGEQTMSALIDALAWCADQRVDLAMMSVGSKSYFHASGMLPIIERAKLNTTMVAAAANDDSITYPACFDAVIGVKGIPDALQPGDLLNVIQSPYDGIEIEAWISDSRVLDICLERYCIEYAKSNSIMVPFVAARLSRILLESGRVAKAELLKILSSGRPVQRGRPLCRRRCKDLPVVLALYRTKSGWDIVDMLNHLVLLFKEDGYSCACLTDFCDKSAFEKSIYAVMDADGLEYYRKALAFNSFLLVAIEENNPIKGDVRPDLTASARDQDGNSSIAFVGKIYKMVIQNMT